MKAHIIQGAPEGVWGGGIALPCKYFVDGPKELKA